MQLFLLVPKCPSSQVDHKLLMCVFAGWILRVGMAVASSLGRRETQTPVGRSVGVGDKEGKQSTTRWSGLAAEGNLNRTVGGVWETTNGCS